MAKTNAEVAAMVERALRENPRLRSVNLQEEAVKIDQTVAQLSGRQFHAQYALPVRRRIFGGETSRKRPVTSSVKRSNPILAILTKSFEEKKEKLIEAIDVGFERAIEADSVSGINSFLSSLDRKTKEFERV